MDDQRTDRKGGGITRPRISLKGTFVVFTAIAVILALATQLYRENARANRIARAYDMLRAAQGRYESLTSLWKSQIATHSPRAAEYEAELLQADEDMKEVQRLMDEMRRN